MKQCNTLQMRRLKVIDRLQFKHYTKDIIRVAMVLFLRFKSFEMSATRVRITNKNKKVT